MPQLSILLSTRRSNVLPVGKKKEKPYRVKLKSEVKIDPTSWAFAHPDEKLDLNDLAAPVVEVNVDASSDDEAVTRAKETVEAGFPDTKDKLTVVGKPLVRTTSEKYVKEKKSKYY